MILVTGHSQKNDGICFIAQTNDATKAVEQALQNWNSRFTDKTKLVTTKSGRTLLLFNETDAETVEDLSDSNDQPRREGWEIVTTQVDTDTVYERMPW